MSAPEEALVQLQPNDQARVMSFCRQTAFVYDQICGQLLELTAALEEAKIIPKVRKTQKHLTTQMKRHSQGLLPNKKLIAEALELAKDHPDPEKIVSLLFRDLSASQVKVIAKKTQEPRKE
jgi:hypothetical protein